MGKVTMAIAALLLAAGTALAQSDQKSTSGAGGAANNKEPTNAPGTTKAPSPTTPSRTDQRTDTGGSGTAAGTAGAAGQLEPGANSFTESQARSRLLDAGYGKITDLAKDDQGIWRGKAEKDGKSVSVGLDYKGNIGAQ